MTKIKCNICKESTEKTTHNKKYCSQKCSTRAWYRRGGNEVRNKLRRTEKYRKIGRENYYKNKEIILIRKNDRDSAVKDQCNICNSTFNLEIHHISYKPSVYIILCKNCHLKEHNKRCLK